MPSGVGCSLGRHQNLGLSEPWYQAGTEADQSHFDFEVDSSIWYLGFLVFLLQVSHVLSASKYVGSGVPLSGHGHVPVGVAHAHQDAFHLTQRTAAARGPHISPLILRSGLALSLH